MFCIGFANGQAKLMPSRNVQVNIVVGGDAWK